MFQIFPSLFIINVLRFGRENLASGSMIYVPLGFSRHHDKWADPRALCFCITKCSFFVSRLLNRRRRRDSCYRVPRIADQTRNTWPILPLQYYSGFANNSIPLNTHGNLFIEIRTLINIERYNIMVIQYIIHNLSRTPRLNINNIRRRL